MSLAVFFFVAALIVLRFTGSLRALMRGDASRERILASFAVLIVFPLVGFIVACCGPNYVAGLMIGGFAVGFAATLTGIGSGVLTLFLEPLFIAVLWVFGSLLGVRQVASATQIVEASLARLGHPIDHTHIGLMTMGVAVGVIVALGPRLYIKLVMLRGASKRTPCARPRRLRTANPTLSDRISQIT